MLLSKEEIEFFKNNQDDITPELLEVLRAQGDEGKHQALEILDMKKNSKMFYLDAFQSQISYEGNKGLKSPGTILDLKPIHLHEIERCLEDFKYFRENYILIKTPTGIGFPDVREYQDRLILKLLDDDKEDVVGLMGRQCIGGDTKLRLSADPADPADPADRSDLSEDQDGYEMTIRELWDLVGA